MSLVSSAAGMLATMIKFTGQTVTYQRGTAFCNLPCEVGRSDWVSEPEEGLAQTLQSTDFIVVAEQLTLSGSRATPATGDRVLRQLNGATEVYEVVPPADGEQCYRYNDPGKVIMRIHSKLIQTR